MGLRQNLRARSSVSQRWESQMTESVGGIRLSQWGGEVRRAVEVTAADLIASCCKVDAKYLRFRLPEQMVEFRSYTDEEVDSALNGSLLVP